MRKGARRFSFSDPSTISAVVETYGWNVTYTQLQPGTIEVGAWESKIGDCVVYRERFGCHLIVHGTSTLDGYDVMLVERGAAKFFGEEISPDVVALFPPESDVDAVAFPGLETLHIQVPQERMRAAADALAVQLIPRLHMRLVAPGVDRLCRVRSAAQQAIEILNDGDLATWKEVEEDLLTTLAALFDRTLHRNRVRQGPIDCPTSYALAVRNHVLSVPLGEIDIGEVADGFGIGRHHLNRCFKAHYGASIQEYIHYRRLHAARDLLSRPAADLTVTEVAYSSGFRHLGRFSIEYKQLFGETPRQTLHRAAQRD